MRRLRSVPATALTLGAGLLLAGCASPPVAPREGASWSGRLALEVENDASRSFSAAFELQGGPETGELTLLSPVGSTLGVLAWSPGQATLRSGGSVRQFASLEELGAQATGAPIPVAALFDWMRGVATPAPGWTVDLSQVGDGRLRARRVDPPPGVDLRAVFGSP